MLGTPARIAMLALTASMCTAPAMGQECLQWRNAVLNPRHSVAMAYDSWRNRTVLFGTALPGETWEWDGTSWRFRTIGGPYSFVGHEMAFDSARGVCVMFGGSGGIGSGNETWEWDGIQWRLRAKSGPPARSGHALAFDSARNVTVLFGGSIGVFPNHFLGGDTWEWDGTTWIPRATTGPSPRAGHLMSYDEIRGRTVLFGGNSTLNDTWEWDGRTWTQIASAGPFGREGDEMAYDASLRSIVLYGGRSIDSLPYPYLASDTWHWDGTTWTEQLIPGALPRHSHGMAYDSARGHIVLACGQTFQTSGMTLSDTWLYQNGAWTQATATPTIPPFTWLAAMAFDSVRDRSVLVGGADTLGPNATYYPTTWEFDGVAWTMRSATGFQPRADQAMAFDSARGVTVMFGGSRSMFPGSSIVYGDTLEWDGTTWTERSTRGPAPRSSPRMAYDSRRNVSLLFGGGAVVNGVNTFFKDTWAWDGQTWKHLADTGPSPRNGHAMAFDEQRGVVVLFGGFSLGDTWEWNGSEWNLRATTGPPPRAYHTMAYDTQRQAVVLYGGSPLDPATWVWNGTQWSKLNIALPAARSHHAMAYDTNRHETIIYGGSGRGYETWRLGATLTIESPPADATAVAGETATLTGRAVGEPPVLYRWFRDGLPVVDGPDISGATTNTLTIDPVTATHTGTYSLTVSSACGSISASANLTVIVPGDATGDLTVDIGDLLAVIGAWGVCSIPPSPCLADVAPVGGDGVVNILDLLMVIANWDL